MISAETSFLVQETCDQRREDSAQPHLNHPAKRQRAAAGEPCGLREVIGEAGEKACQKTDFQRRARTGPKPWRAQAYRCATAMDRINKSAIHWSAKKG
jgi:hypothetical protein